MSALIINDGAGRNLLGGVFPLVANAMFTNMGYPAASSLLGGIVRNLFPPPPPTAQVIYHLTMDFRVLS